MGTRRGRSRTSHENWWKQSTGGMAHWVLVSLVAVLVIGGGLVATNLPERPTAAAPGSTPQTEFSFEKPDPEPRPTVSDAVKLLDDTARPWTMTVIGDSTGNGENEWVYLTAEELSSRYSRPVTIHNWDNDNAIYATETVVGSGPNAPITVWNGSASGRGADYSLQNVEALAPERADLVIVSHGLNHNAENAVPMTRSLVTAIKNRSLSTAVLLTLQNPRIDADAADHESVISTLRDYAEGASLETVDVYSRFAGTGDVTPLLLQDGFHPSDRGEVEWSSEVVRVLLGT